MRFLDEAKIYLKSGGGGNGCLSFRREANVPMGGPDGGDGGRGGHVYARATSQLATLIDYRYQQHFKAKRGEDGKGRMRYGKNGEDIVLIVPKGTQIVCEDTGIILADLDEDGAEVQLLRGGDGGLGNAHFKSSVNRAPRRTVPGGEPQEITVRLKLKLLSDAGLIGLPNAGKSTFLASVSRARPKIADYPFTTLRPQLGVVYVDEKEFVLADIPGLIAGASQGAGLGIQFLKHVERCRALIHLIDGTEDNPGDVYRTVRAELAAYNPELAEKTEFVALNKIDALTDDEIQKKIQELRDASGKEVFAISAAAAMNVTDILRAVQKEIRTDDAVMKEKPPVIPLSCDPTPLPGAAD